MQGHGADQRGIVVAIDGPSGSGKSSTSRGVAKARRFRYLDTGAMYRALTWWMLENGVDVTDTAAVAKYAGEPRVDSGLDPIAPTITVDEIDVAAAIRDERVTAAVSAVAAVPEVRERLVALQRDAIAAARQAGTGIVVEGRDITTVVAPDADVRLYLTASAQARATRRSTETGARDVAATLAALSRRDRLDSSRDTSPLTRGSEVMELDTTPFNLTEVIDIVVQLVDETMDRGVVA